MKNSDLKFLESLSVYGIKSHESKWKRNRSLCWYCPEKKMYKKGI